MDPKGIIRCLTDLNHHVGGLQIACLFRERRHVVVGLEEVRRQCRGRREEGSGLLNLAPPHFQHAEVVEGFGVVVVGRQGEPKALVGQAGVADSKPDVPDVVPNVP